MEIILGLYNGNTITTEFDTLTHTPPPSPPRADVTAAEGSARRLCPAVWHCRV